MKRLLIIGTAVLALSTTAIAGSCPTLVEKIDEALKTTELGDADKAKVTDLRNQGEEQHKTGAHADAVATLTEGLKALGM